MPWAPTRRGQTPAPRPKGLLATCEEQTILLSRLETGQEPFSPRLAQPSSQSLDPTHSKGARRRSPAGPNFRASPESERLRGCSWRPHSCFQCPQPCKHHPGHPVLALPSPSAGRSTPALAKGWKVVQLPQEARGSLLGRVCSSSWLALPVPLSHYIIDEKCQCLSGREGTASSQGWGGQQS